MWQQARPFLEHSQPGESRGKGRGGLGREDVAHLGIVDGRGYGKKWFEGHRDQSEHHLESRDREVDDRYR